MKIQVLVLVAVVSTGCLIDSDQGDRSPAVAVPGEPLEPPGLMFEGDECQAYDCVSHSWNVTIETSDDTPYDVLLPMPLPEGGGAQMLWRWLSAADVVGNATLNGRSTAEGLVLHVQGTGAVRLSAALVTERSINESERLHLDWPWSTAGSEQNTEIVIWADTLGMDVQVTYEAVARACGRAEELEGSTSTGWFSIPGTGRSICQ